MLQDLNTLSDELQVGKALHVFMHYALTHRCKQRPATFRCAARLALSLAAALVANFDELLPIELSPAMQDECVNPIFIVCGILIYSFLVCLKISCDFCTTLQKSRLGA